MTREEALKILDSIPTISEQVEALELAINALEQEPCEKDWRFYYDHGYAQAKRDLSCEDAISRQAVIDWCGDINMDVYTNEVKEFVIQLPSVNQEPKTGHWIEKDGFDGDVYYDCSECGESFCLIDGTPTDNLFDYCPNCGAKMVEPQEEGDKE